MAEPALGALIRAHARIGVAVGVGLLGPAAAKVGVGGPSAGKGGPAHCAGTLLHQGRLHGPFLLLRSLRVGRHGILLLAALRRRQLLGSSRAAVLVACHGGALLLAVDGLLRLPDPRWRTGPALRRGAVAAGGAPPHHRGGGFGRGLRLSPCLAQRLGELVPGPWPNGEGREAGSAA